MYHPDYQKTLELASEIHGGFRKFLKPEVQDKKLAIYYIQGGCITQAMLSLNAWGYGDLNTPLRAKRFIDEAFMLALFFSVLENDDRHIKRWWQNQIVTLPDFRKDLLLKNKILNKMGWDESILKTYLEKGSNLYQAFSKGVHPNLEAVAYNTRKETLEFDYGSQQLSYYPIRNFDFATFIIIPAIDTLLTNVDILEIDPSDFVALRKARAGIEAIAKQQRITRKPGP